MLWFITVSSLPGTEFLAKPFGIDQLAAKVRAVLDQT
jgi:DNA-binding response OmpR family regulator